MRSEQPGGCAA
ncbi:Protein of unknown function [Weissella confusa LBAE C39-2]|nr:Protein of unknown function [Weissella confusa LBAE C39-2]